MAPNMGSKCDLRMEKLTGLHATHVANKGAITKLISSLSSVIVQVSEVLKRTVDDSDLRFDDLSSGHLQSQSDIDLIGQLNCHVIEC